MTRLSGTPSRWRRGVLGGGVAISVALSGALATTFTATADTAEPTPSHSFGAVADVAPQERGGVVGFVGSADGRAIDTSASAGAAPAKVATSFVSRHAADFGLGAGSSLAVLREGEGVDGGHSVRLRQEVRGVPVMGGEFAVSLDADNGVLSVLGESTSAKGVASEPGITAAKAAATATAAVAKAEDVKAGSLTASTPELMVYDPKLLGTADPLGARLAWVTDVRDGGAVGRMVVVDAAKPVVALSFDSVHAARNRTVCDANNSATQVPCTTPVWTETSQPATGDTDVQRAFAYTGDTYDFFANRYGRDSLDGAGMQLKTTVDYCDPMYPCPYQNAFWNGEQMVYGDGFASADDVVGHELAHGLTDHTSKLYYYAQSGAINESMSDVFGEIIDQTNSGGTDTAAVKWQMGEDIPGIGAIRNMADPTAFGDPDRMLSPDYMSGYDDAEGVHYNSGVNNKAAFLMSDGGTFNGQTITGLGTTKVARLYYTVNTSMLVSASDYADLARALRQSCANLAAGGVDGFTAADCTQVERAVVATEMDANPTKAATTDATVCPTGTQVLATPLADNLEAPAGQFTTSKASGPADGVWFYPQNSHPYEGWDATFATSGRTNLWGDNTDVVSDGAIRMTNPVTVPSTGGALHFSHAYMFEQNADATQFFDGGVLEYSTAGANGPWQDAGALPVAGLAPTRTIHTGEGNPLAGRKGFAGSSRGYGSTRVDLASLAGKSVTFRWRIGTDNAGAYYGWFVDDVTIAQCGQPTTTPPPTPLPKDTTPPQTKIVKHPKKKTSSRVAKFKVKSNEAGSRFQCKLDKKKWKSCKGKVKGKKITVTYKKVKPGKHTFKVRAIDRAGNRDRSPAKFTWRVMRRR